MLTKIMFVGVCFVLSVSVARGADLTVGPPGSGAAFSDIQAAVNAAAPGDRIFVLAGTYNGSIVVSKAIEIIGAGSSVTILRTYAVIFPGQVPPALQITALVAGARIRVSGMTFTTNGVISTMSLLASIDNCDGLVELCDVAFNGNALPPAPPSTLTGILTIRDCRQVVAANVRSTGIPTTLAFPFNGPAATMRGTNGMLVERSSVWMTDCTASGNATRQPGVSGFGGDGGDGLAAIDAALDIARSRITGAQSGGLQPGVAAFGGAGLRMTRCSVLVSGGAGNFIAGAPAFENTLGGLPGLGHAGNAVVVDAASTFAAAIDASLVGGSGTASLPAAAAINAAPGAIVATVGARLPVIALVPAHVSPGGSFNVEISGEANLEYIRAVALSTSPAFEYAGAYGALLVDPNALLIFTVEGLGPTGQVSFGVSVPAIPGLAGLVVVEQIAQFTSAGVAISPPALMAID